MFGWRQVEHPERGEHGVDWGFTDRRGGVSTGTYSTLNLAAHVGDDDGSVRTNRSRLAAALGVAPCALRFMDQRHGDRVVVLPPRPVGSPTGVPVCDGQLTRDVGLVLVVLVADCTPVLLLDRARGVVAAVHAGRLGLVGGVAPAAVARMRELGSASVEALVGPAICGRCYEVPEAMQQKVATHSPASATRSWQDTPALDVSAGVVDQLTRAGVRVRQVPGCSREDPELFSYRRDSQTGRYAGFVRLLPRDETIRPSVG